MAFTTGSGTFTDLQNAIIAHAISVGWTEANGLGTGFPLNIGPTFVDLQTYTQTDTDFTLGSDRGTFLATYGALGLGVDAASASADAALGNGAAARIPNAGFIITNYFIYSDPLVSDYVHVCFEFTNGVDPQVYQHFSFGQINKAGFTHGGVSYVASGYRRGYAASTSGGSSNEGLDWNTLNRGSWPFGGQVGENDDSTVETSFIVHAPNFADSAQGFPAAGVLTRRGSLLWDTSRMGTDTTGMRVGSANSGSGYKIGYTGMQIINNPPFTGAISMQILPFVVSNNAGASGSIVWGGVFPDVRQCNMTNFLPGDEVSFGSDTWQIFPWTKQTDNGLLNDQLIVTSGQAALAYRKVI